MIWGIFMDSVKNLVTILNLLDTQWRKLTSDLTSEQLALLKNEFMELQNKMKSMENIDEMNNLSKDFIQGFSNVEPLDFLAKIDQPQMRGGSINDVVDEIRIKIINYCVNLQERIDNKENLK